MSITDELREWSKEHLSRSSILAIADRIDAEHERLMQEQPFTIDMVPMTDEHMAEHGWVRLPVDADGKHVQPSDIPHLTKVKDGKRLAYYPSLELRQDGTWRLAGWTLDRYRIIKPTVEDVMVEFATDWESAQDGEDKTAVLKEYAAKLRLAGEDA